MNQNGHGVLGFEAGHRPPQRVLILASLLAALLPSPTRVEGHGNVQITCLRGQFFGGLLFALSIKLQVASDWDHRQVLPSYASVDGVGDLVGNDQQLCDLTNCDAGSRLPNAMRSP